MTVALFCGSRNWQSRNCRDWLRERIRAELRTLDPEKDRIIQGGAKGADKIADWEAMLMGLRTDSFPADWNKFQLRAGHERNGQMKDELVRAREGGESVIVYAFHNDPGFGKGTADMIHQAADAGITSKLLVYGDQPPHDVETACFIVFDGEGRMLLQHRTDDAPSFPGFHGLFGGSLELDELPEDALRREAKEELGIDIWELVPCGEYLFQLPGEVMRIHAWMLDLRKAPLGVDVDFLHSSQREGQGLDFYAPREIEALDVPDQDRAVLRMAEAVLVDVL